MMKVIGLSFLIGVTSVLATVFTSTAGSGNLVTLPPPKRDGKLSLERALLKRRSIRTYSATPLSLAELSQLLWAGQGITSKRGFRTASSAGALYPLEMYVAAGNVKDLPAGVYRYKPRGHKLETVGRGDRRGELCAAALGQQWVKNSAAVIVIGGVYGRTTKKYGPRGIRYVHIEVGCALQNIHLQAASLGLGAVPVGAFDDAKVKKILNMTKSEQALCIMPVGKVK